MFLLLARTVYTRGVFLLHMHTGKALLWAMWWTSGPWQPFNVSKRFFSRAAKACKPSLSLWNLSPWSLSTLTTDNSSAKNSTPYWLFHFWYHLGFFFLLMCKVGFVPGAIRISLLLRVYSIVITNFIFKVKKKLKLIFIGIFAQKSERIQTVLSRQPPRQPLSPGTHTPHEKTVIPVLFHFMFSLSWTS